jgi:hypothetical protein
VLPLARVPETKGFTVAVGSEVTACVDLVNLTVDPAVFVAVTLAIINLPTFEFVRPIDEPVPVTAEQPLGNVPDSLSTIAEHSNH